MYYCHNCFGRFARPIKRFAPYPDYGGEHYACCPLCGAPDDFERDEQQFNSRGRFLRVNLTQENRPLELGEAGK